MPTLKLSKSNPMITAAGQAAGSTYVGQNSSDYWQDQLAASVRAPLPL